MGIRRTRGFPPAAQGRGWGWQRAQPASVLQVSVVVGVASRETRQGHEVPGALASAESVRRIPRFPCGTERTMRRIDTQASTIHGHGVFAKETIRRGQFIGRYLARRTETDGPYTLWVEHEEGVRGYDGFGRLRFLNHASQPNAEFDDRDLYATRTIRSGEEITIDYGEAWVGISALPGS